MDLKFCLKCILNFIFCIWLSESVNSMECEIGKSVQKPDVSLHCYPSSDFRGTPKENCQFFSCKKNETVNWKIINPKNGELQIQMQNLPKSCDFEWYDIDLEIYDEKEIYNEALMCDTGNLPWKIHSKRTLETFCSNCTSKSPEDCIEVHTAKFKYVYPGIYRIKVTPYVSGSTRQAQRSYRMLINNTVTHYVQKKFSDLSLNASLQYRSKPRELDLGIPFLIENPPESVKVDVKFSDSNVHLYGIKYRNENTNSITCQIEGDLPLPDCEVKNADLRCKFSNMSQGFYSIHVHFIDDRCKKGTVWANQYSDPCYWIIRKTFTQDGTVVDTVTPNRESASKEVIYTIILLVFIIGVLIVSFVAKKINWRRQRPGNEIVRKASENASRPLCEKTYSFTNGTNRFSIGHLLTVPDRPKPEVLLIYPRESPPFMDLIVSFKKILNNVCKSKVYDYFDSNFWNEVSGDPKGWVYSLIVERQAKVIIIASEVAPQYQPLIDETSTSPSEFSHPFDHLFLYAVRLLRDKMDENSYKNHFVVTFSGFSENHLLEYFNPYLRFELPKHLNKLFDHLHDAETTHHFDHSRLEERDEVREFRLQLEHVINMKLLSKSDFGKNLYGW